MAQPDAAQAQLSEAPNEPKAARLHYLDWLQALAILGISCTLYFFSAAAGVPVWEWLGSPGTPGFYLSWVLWGTDRLRLVE